MNQILALFLPAILAIYIYEKLIKKELKLREWIIKYFLFVLSINIVDFAISIYVFKKPYFIFTNLFTLKYLLLGIVVGIVVALIFSFIEKNVEIRIRIENNEK